MRRLNQIIIGGARNNISDIHLVSGQPIAFRRNGRLSFDRTNVFSANELGELASKLMKPRDVEIFETRKSVDFATTINNIRIRINMFQNMQGLGIAIRLLPSVAPTIDQLNLHPSLKQYCKVTDGLILICGSTGAGKSGTIAAMVEEINQNSPSRIITLEDPVEYRFTSQHAFISQRELGSHTPTFEQGLIDVLREDSDVIVVGELRDTSTMRLALHAAESGHLVITTLHASSPEDALHRICNSFPAGAQDMVRHQLASTLSLLVVQRLVLMPGKNFRIPLLSIMRGTHSIKSIIRENRLAQLNNAIHTGKQDGMFSMEIYQEYLSARHDFTPPSIVFNPTNDTSPVIEPVADIQIKVTIPQEERKTLPRTGTTVPAKSPSAPPVSKPLGTTPSPGQKTPTTNDLGQHYVIDEDVSMEDVINEMKKSQRYS